MKYQKEVLGAVGHHIPATSATQKSQEVHKANKIHTLCKW